MRPLDRGLFKIDIIISVCFFLSQFQGRCFNLYHFKKHLACVADGNLPVNNRLRISAQILV